MLVVSDWVETAGEAMCMEACNTIKDTKMGYYFVVDGSITIGSQKLWRLSIEQLSDLAEMQDTHTFA